VPAPMGRRPLDQAFGMLAITLVRYQRSIKTLPSQLNP
jgi:hypothetical protein